MRSRTEGITDSRRERLFQQTDFYKPGTDRRQSR